MTESSLTVKGILVAHAGQRGPEGGRLLQKEGSTRYLELFCNLANCERDSNT